MSADRKPDGFTSQTVQELIKSISKLTVEKVLDLGCGQGETMAMLSPLGLRCVGIDPAIKSLRVAKETAPVAQASGDILPFINECFDVVILKEVIHHVSHPSTVLSEARRCLRAGGYLWLLEPVEDDPILRLGRNLYPYWEGMRVESRFYARQLAQLINESRFEIVSSGGNKGGFPYYFFHWLKITAWMLSQHLRLPWPDWEFLKQHVIIGYQGKVLYYWCLARKKD